MFQQLLRDMLTGQAAKLTSAVPVAIPAQEIAGDFDLPLVDLDFPVIVPDLEFHANFKNMPVPMPQIFQTARRCSRPAVKALHSHGTEYIPPHAAPPICSVR